MLKLCWEEKKKREKVSGGNWKNSRGEYLGARRESLISVRSCLSPRS